MAIEDTVILHFKNNLNPAIRDAGGLTSMTNAFSHRLPDMTGGNFKNVRMELLRGRQLLNKANKLVAVEDVIKNNNIILFYFGALWCTSPDCKLVLQKLKDVHRENLKRNTGIEVVFVSSDTDQEDFETFYRTQGSWYAVPFEEPLAQELRMYFGITNIPNLIAVKKNGEIITRTGKQELVEKGINVLVSWTE